MRSLLMLAVLLGSFATAFADDSAPGATNTVTSLSRQGEAATGRVVKVLPLFLDLNGHDAISPSLFDRDAYQAHLRQHTNEVSAIRFDVLWKATNAKDAKLKLRAELRGIGDRGLPSQTVLENEVAPGTFSSWTSLPLGGDDLKKFGSLIAWRVTLWDGDQLLAEQKSFLW
jgi:hypothetical protein